MLIKRKNPPDKGLWAVPGGRVELGENLIDAVKREVKEETNLEVIVKEFADISEKIAEEKLSRT